MKHNITCPSGFPEFTPAQEKVRQDWIEIITTIFRQHGGIAVTTPMVEREENLVAKGGDPKEIYVLKRLHDDDGDASHSGNALRFDQTVPLALYTARHMNDIKFPFKRYVIGESFRGERAQKGRYRQFTQCDLDVIGMEKLSVSYDAEMIAVIAEIFEALNQKYNLGDFVIRVNNRKLLLGFFDSLGIPAEHIKDALDIIDDVEKVDQKTTEDRFAQLGISNDSVAKLHTFISQKGQNVENEDFMKTVQNPLFEEGMRELKEVFSTLEAMGVNPDRYVWDPAIARGLDYYTGTVFEAVLLNDKINGSVAAGGRYDDLGGVFTGKNLPGVGMSIGLTRLIGQIFEEKIIVPEKVSSVELMILMHDRAYMTEACELVRQLRSEGVMVDIYLEDKKLGKQFDYAAKLGIPYCGVLGENEAKNKTVSLKNMETGEQKEVKWGEVKENLQ